MTRVKGQSTLQVRSGEIREFWVDGMLRHEIGRLMATQCWPGVVRWYNAGPTSVSENTIIMFTPRWINAGTTSWTVAQQ